MHASATSTRGAGHRSLQRPAPRIALLPAALLLSLLMAPAVQAAAPAGPVVARPSVPPRPLALANGIRFDGPSTAPATGADRLFVLHCAGCHGFDGSGHPDQGVPDMRDALGHFLQTPEGRAFIVQVPGVNNAGLDDAQIAAVTNWALQQFSATTLPSGWQRYSTTEVAEHRRQRPIDVAARRAVVVQGLQARGVPLY